MSASSKQTPTGSLPTNELEKGRKREREMVRSHTKGCSKKRDERGRGENGLSVHGRRPNTSRET